MTALPRNRIFLNHDQGEALRQEIRSSESSLANPLAQDKAGIRKQLGRMRKQLEEQSPPQLDAEGRDTVSARVRELEASIKDGMPSHEEMRKAPDGAVGAHMAWEKRNKPNIIEWKNGRMALHPGDPDPDLSSVERLRPRTSVLDMSTAQIPGQSFSFPSERFKENYNDAFGKTEEGQAEGPEARLPAARGTKRAKQTMTPAQRKASSDRMTARWAAKRAAAAAATQGEQSAAP